RRSARPSARGARGNRRRVRDEGGAPEADPAELRVRGWPLGRAVGGDTPGACDQPSAAVLLPVVVGDDLPDAQSLQMAARSLLKLIEPSVGCERSGRRVAGGMLV